MFHPSERGSTVKGKNVLHPSEKASFVKENNALHPSEKGFTVKGGRAHSFLLEQTPFWKG